MSQVAVCCDGRKPQPISTSHGPVWVTLWLPLPAGRRLYVGAASGRRWTGRSPYLRVTVRKTLTGRRWRLSIHRWCGHVVVRYVEGESCRAQEPEGDQA